MDALSPGTGGALVGKEEEHPYLILLPQHLHTVLLLKKRNERCHRLQKGLDSVSQITQQRGHKGFLLSVISRHNKHAGAVVLPQEGKNPLLRL